MTIRFFSRRNLAPLAIIVFLLCWLFAATPLGAQGNTPRPEWVEIDYSEVIDRRQLSHSGESVGTLLARLDGRPLPVPGQRPSDRVAHTLLEPLVEPYGFVLSDALDSLVAPGGGPWFELGSLWRAGGPQPAWVELLRSRRLIVESDGKGKLRACLPWAGPETGNALPTIAGRAAAEAAWESAWPVLRHVVQAERRRLGRAVQVEIYAYRHRIEGSEFHLGLEPYRTEVTDTGPSGLRPPLDLAGIETFLNSGLRLEGARIEADGSLNLLGSPTGTQTLLGRPIALSDFAVAYRAVFHGGLAEPFMSLDRGLSPHVSLVNYGARLRDTSIGLVSLLCDIRFKTFSQGLDIVEGLDLRDRVRAEIAGFRTHIERMADDPASEGQASQQTRMWFYPDSVDMTVSSEGDVLVFRRVRMSAASERAEEGEGQVPPWTGATIEAIDAQYDELARFFPELADLDQVVRLLSLFTWLKQLDAEGLRLPELGSLLALELPALSTPREFPQLLAFDSLPPRDRELSVDVVNRVPVGLALSRMRPAYGRPLSARRRYDRAAAELDPSIAAHARLLESFGSTADSADGSTLDAMTYRLERLAMHERVLATQDPSALASLAAWQKAGKPPRVFSVGIGGLDLGMGKVLARAEGRAMSLLGGSVGTSGAEVSAPRHSDPTEARQAWQQDPPGLPAIGMPSHGPKAMAVTDRFESGRSGKRQWTLTVYGVDGMEVRSRRTEGAVDRIEEIERVERLRRFRYRLDREGSKVSVRALKVAQVEPPEAVEGPLLPSSLGLLEIPPTGADEETPKIRLRLQSAAGGGKSAGFPRRSLKRLILGRSVDLTSGSPLQGLAPLPTFLGTLESMMVLLNPTQRTPPWIPPSNPVAAEEDPLRLGRALSEWWATDAGSAPAAVIGTDPATSPDRWEAAPRPSANATLIVPDDAFDDRSAGLRDRLIAAWSPKAVVAGPEELSVGELVLVVSAEPPELFAERLRRLSGAPQMTGKLLGAWSLAGPLRHDLPATWIAEGRIAGFGLADPTVVGVGTGVDSLAELARALDSAAGGRVEQLPGPFLWFF